MTILFPAQRTLLAPAMIVLTLLLCGCATARDPRDPLEPYNRAMYKINDKLDRAALKPAARFYKFITPKFVRTGINNFFGNFGDVLIAFNNLLQGKLVAGASDVGRIAVNSTIGIAGLIDVGTPLGLKKHDEDFGQTLGAWGVPTGPYFVIPLLGPSTIRDGTGMAGTLWADPFNWTLHWTFTDYVAQQWRTGAGRAVNLRANVLDTTNMLDQIALDPYEFQRNAYLQYRENLVRDGAMPKQQPPSDEDDIFDDLPKANPAPAPAPAK